MPMFGKGAFARLRDQIRNGVASLIPVPSTVTRNAVYTGNLGSVSTNLLTGTGATVSSSTVFFNESGAPITVATLIFSNWRHTELGYTLFGANSRTATIEYPIGSTPQTVTASASGTITLGSAWTNLVCDPLTLTTPIPAGAAFKYNVSGVVPNAQKYGDTKLGLTAIMTTAAASSLRSESLAILGDSITDPTTQGLNPIYAAAKFRCPLLQFSISATQVSYYATGTNFDPQTDLIAKAGCTRLLNELSINDTFAGQTDATTWGYLTAIQAKMTGIGVLYTQSTQTIRMVSTVATVTASSVTSSGTTMSIVVPDATKFTLNNEVKIAGAGQSEYNIVAPIEAINTSTNMLTIPFAGSATPTATGTITLANDFYIEQPGIDPPATNSPAYRAALNARIRTTGAFTGGYVEVGDAVEPTRGSNKWVVGAQSPELRPAQAATITAVLSASQIVTNVSLGMEEYSSNGRITFTSGANRGFRTTTQTFADLNTIVCAVTPTATPSIGDTVILNPASNGATSDGVHPQGVVATVSLGGYSFNETGGAAIFARAYRDWLASLGLPYGVPNIAGTGFADEFNRREEALEASANWALLSGPAGRARVYMRGLSAATTTAAPAVYRSPDQGSADHWTEIEWRTLGNANNWICNRLTDASNAVILSIASATVINLITRIGGSNVTFASITLATALTDRDRLKYGIVGGTVSLSRNGVALTPTTGTMTPTALPPSTTRQGFIARQRGEICRRYAAGI